MAHCNVIIADAFELTKVGTFGQEMVDRVKFLYTDCIAFANRGRKPADLHTFNVTIALTKPAPGGLDVLVYLLPADFRSIVAKKNGGARKDNLLTDHWGFTMPHGAAGGALSAESELIHKSFDGNVLGSLVFHEALHYKTFKGNQALHSTGGLGAAVVGPDTKLNDANRNDIASTLSKSITGFPDGWDDCIQAKKRKEAGDIFWNS